MFFREDHSLSSFTGFGYYLIRYDEQGYYIDNYSFQLNELELKLPNLVDYINSHTWIGNEPAVYENQMQGNIAIPLIIGTILI